jgi:ribonuclease R
MSSKKLKFHPKERKLNTGQLLKEVLHFFQQNPGKKLNPRQVASKLKISNNHDSMLYAMQQLENSGHLSVSDDYKFMFKKRTASPGRKTLEGIIDITRSGAAYVECAGLSDDVYVSAKDLGSALHGDRVVISVWTPRGRRRAEGEVLKVVERASDQFVGTIYFSRNEARIIPSRQDIHIDIKVDLADAKGAEDGDRVIVRVTEWHKSSDGQPKGVVVTVLGAEGSDLEMKTILINNGFNLFFPEEVITETGKLSSIVTEEEIAKRRDFRRIPTFTIDPEDAKDFDDALSIRNLVNGGLEIGVHIADVSHFIKPGSELDKEAFRRSTSVYLVDRVLPMLPEKLSNELCSLRPFEDKLTYSVVFTFNEKDKITHRWMGRTIIHSVRCR